MFRLGTNPGRIGYMKRSLSGPLRAAGMATLVCLSFAPRVAISAASHDSEGNRQSIEQKYNVLPLRFEPNQGQSSPDAKFIAQGRGFSAAFSENEADFLLAGNSTSASHVRMRLVNASRRPAIAGENRLPGTVNYLIGNDPQRWHTSLPTFERLRYTNVYPRTDLIYYGAGGRLEFDFQLSAGADPDAIRMRFEGAQKITVDGAGNLVISADGQRMSFLKPEIYQPRANGGKDKVGGSFRIAQGKIVRFRITRYDRSRPLVIDPIFNYSTYIGGPLAEATAVAVDPAGEAYVTGWANLAFPTTSLSFQPVPVTTTAAGGYPAAGRIFVAKLNSSGSDLLFATYLDGSGLDAAYGIALDANGNPFVVGTTSSRDFPITPGALQTKNTASQSTGFVTVLNSSGAALVYSTYLGGTTYTAINRIAVDALGNAYLTGMTQDTDFPTTPGSFQPAATTKTAANESSGFITKLNPSGTALVYSTYLAGSGSDVVSAIVLDTSGAAYGGGYTTSTDFPTTAGSFQRTAAAGNKQAGFVTKLSPDGSALVYSSYLSGKGGDAVMALAVDATGVLYAAGSTTSPDFPITAGAYQPNIGYNGFGYPQLNAFVSKFNAAGSALDYSTFLGGNTGLYLADQGDGARAINLDRQGNAIVTGIACTIDFPITSGAFQGQNLAMETSGECSSFLTKINPVANTPLIYSTYLGGSGDQTVFGGDLSSDAVVDSSGNVYMVGSTDSVDFPVTSGVYVTPFGSQFTSDEAFITVFNSSELEKLPIPTVKLTSSTNSVVFSEPVTFTATVQSFGNRNTPTGFVGFNFLQQEISDANGSGIGMGPWTTVPMNGSGVATFTTSSLVALQTPVVAHYLGDANNAPSTGTMTQTLTEIQTVTTLTASADNVPYGTKVVFTASVVDQNGKPAKGTIAMGMGNIWYVETGLDANGKATWTNGQGGPPLAVGTDTIFATFLQETGYQASTATLPVTFTPLGTTPAPTFNPPAGTYTSAQQVYLNDANPLAAVSYTTDGSTPVVSPGGLPAGTYIYVNSTETVNVIAVVAGYSPSSVVSATYTINLPPPGFTISAPGMSITHGASGNATVTVNPSGDFLGNVTLTAAVTSSPAGAVDPPTLSFGSTTPVNIYSPIAGYATLTISTTPDSRAALRPPAGRSRHLSAPGGALFACILIFSARLRRRTWSALLGLAFLLVALTSGVMACGSGGGGGGGSSGTTLGAYTITVTGTSGTLTATGKFSLTVY